MKNDERLYWYGICHDFDMKAAIEDGLYFKQILDLKPRSVERKTFIDQYFRVKKELKYLRTKIGKLLYG